MKKFDNGKSIQNSIKNIQEKKHMFVEWSDHLRAIALRGKNWLSSIIQDQREWIQTKVFVTLCPLYDWNGWLSSDMSYFQNDHSWLPGRINNKLLWSLELLWFIQKEFNTKVSFILADKGMLIEHDELLEDKIKMHSKVYEVEIAKRLWEGFNIHKMSEFDLPISHVENMNFLPTESDFDNILSSYYKNPQWRILKSLSALIESFWPTVAYYELLNYAKFSQYFWVNYKNSILLNTEWLSSSHACLSKCLNNLSDWSSVDSWGNVLVNGILKKF